MAYIRGVYDNHSPTEYGFKRIKEWMSYNINSYCYLYEKHSIVYRILKPILKTAKFIYKRTIGLVIHAIFIWLILSIGYTARLIGYAFIKGLTWVLSVLTIIGIFSLIAYVMSLF